MVTKSLLNPILDNDHLTRGLQDPEARILVEWLVERAEALATQGTTGTSLQQRILGLCHRARSISLFVRLWCHQESRGAACQLAATERFAWPLPVMEIDPCDLMADILSWEEAKFSRID